LRRTSRTNRLSKEKKIKVFKEVFLTMGSTDSDKPDLEKLKEFTEKIQNDKRLPQNMSKLLNRPKVNA
jgi:hypothetical protein